MDNKNQNTNVVFPHASGGQSPAQFEPPQTFSDPQALSTDAVALGSLSPDPGANQPLNSQPNILVRVAKRADIILAVLLILGSIGFLLTRNSPPPADVNNVGAQYESVEIPLIELISSEGITLGAQKVTINGTLVLAPGSQPTNVTAGQMYYDQTSNVLAYYNGTEFVPLAAVPTTTAATTTTVAAAIQSAGTGLALNGTQISNSGVLSIQGQAGNVTLTAGNGIDITGTTISNTGVASLVSTNPTLVVSDDGDGNYELTVNLGGAGVTSLNGLAGVLSVANATAAGSTITIDDASTAAKGIAQFNPTNFSAVGGIVNTIQNINTGASPTFAGVNTNTITPTGTLTVGATGQQLILQGNASTQLTAIGGGFTTSLGFAGIPTGAVNYTLDRSVAAGTYSLCSTVGNCAGTGTGVTSVVGGTGNRLAKFTAAQNIENSTISDDGTNVTTSADLIIQGGDTTIGVASSQTGTLNFAHSGSASMGSIIQGALAAPRSYFLPDANGTFCLTSGNCSGSGSSNTLQAAYDAGNSITTTDSRSIILTLADTATDANMLINLECDTACSTNGRFAIQDDGTDVFTVSPTGGATTFQNSADSNSAFRILNASPTSGEVLGVDTIDSIIRLLANNTGHLTGTGTTWSTGTPLPAARAVGASVIVNGYLYQLGGCDAGGGAQTTVTYAPINSDGSIGSWSPTTSLPQAMCGGIGAATYNGYIYLHGAAGGAATSRDIYYAKPGPDGKIASWTTQNDPTNLADHVVAGMASFNGYLYISGGKSEAGTRDRNVYYGRINADGSVPSFTVQTDWLTDIDHDPGQVAIVNGYLYVMGSANYNKFYYGKIDSGTGAVATVAEATGAVSTFKKYGTISVLNGFMYAIAGGTDGSVSIEYAPIGSTGDLGSFTVDTTTLAAPASPRTICPAFSPTYNNFIYVVGCGDENFVATPDVYYASGTRVKVGGGLDLTGYSGEGAPDGGTAGQLSAGNTSINGTLSVTGNSNFKDGAVVGNNFTVNGLASFQTTSNSATGFQVLNASAVPQFVVDTSDSRVHIGNPTADSTAALLVLDVKHTTGDPTGIAGGMYYNSKHETFRCYENDKWGECLGTPKPNTHRTTKMVANGNDNVWTGYGDILANTAPSGSGGSLSSNLVPSVYNDTTASIGSAAGVSGNAIYLGDRLIYQTHLDTSDTSVRIWAGLTGEDLATMAASATPAGEFAAFRYDTGAGDATWKCITRDGVTATTADSGIAIADDQKFEIVLDDGVRAVFKINGQIICTIATTLPSVNFRAVNSITALDAAVKTIYVGWIYVEGDPL